MPVKCRVSCARPDDPDATARTDSRSRSPSRCSSAEKPVSSSILRIRAAGVRICNEPPAAARRAAPCEMTASPDASMNRSPARSKTTAPCPRSIIVSKKAPNSGAVRASTSPVRERTTSLPAKLAPTEKSERGRSPATTITAAGVERWRGGRPGAGANRGRSGCGQARSLGRRGGCPDSGPCDSQ